MEGDLNMHGISRTVLIPFALVHGEQEDPWKNYRITVQAAGEVNRLDFGVGEGQNTIGESVEVEFVITGRIFNTETIGLFNRRFGQRMVEALEKGGIAAGRAEVSKLEAEEDKDVGKLSSFEFLVLKLKQKGNRAASLEAAELSAEIFRGEAEAHSILGYTLYENDKIENAKRTFEKALELDSKETLAIEMLKVLNAQ